MDEQRVERLERQVRHLRQIVAAVGVAFVGAITLGAFTPDVEILKVRGLAVVDDAGQVRFAVVTTPDGVTALTLNGSDGVPRILLGSGGAGSATGLAVNDDKGALRFVVAANEGSAFVSLHNSDGKPVWGETADQ